MVPSAVSHFPSVATAAFQSSPQNNSAFCFLSIKKKKNKVPRRIAMTDAKEKTLKEPGTLCTQRLFKESPWLLIYKEHATWFKEPPPAVAPGAVYRQQFLYVLVYTADSSGADNINPDDSAGADDNVAALAEEMKSSTGKLIVKTSGDFTVGRRLAAGAFRIRLRLVPEKCSFNGSTQDSSQTKEMQTATAAASSKTYLEVRRAHKNVLLIALPNTLTPDLETTIKNDVMEAAASILRPQQES